MMARLRPWLVAIALTFPRSTDAHTAPGQYAPFTTPLDTHKLFLTPPGTHSLPEILPETHTPFPTPLGIHTPSPTTPETPRQSLPSAEASPTARAGGVTNTLPLDITDAHSSQEDAERSAGSSLHPSEADDREAVVHMSDDGREDPTNIDHTVNDLLDILRNVRVGVISVSSSATDTKPSGEQADLKAEEGDENKVKFIDETKNFDQEDSPEFDNKTIAETAIANDMISVSVRVPTVNQTFDQITAGPVLDLSNTSGVNNSVTSTSTGGHPGWPQETTTPGSPTPRIPVCRLNSHDKNIIFAHSPKTSNLFLPLASGKCNEPELHAVVYGITVNMTCAADSLMRTTFNKTRKIVYRENQLYFLWDHLQIKDFCIEEGSEPRAVVCHTRPAVRMTENCTGTTCLKKCCPEGYVLKNRSCVCHEASPSLSVTVRQFLVEINQTTDENTKKQVQVGFPHCPNPEMITIRPSSSGRRKFKLLANSRLIIEDQSPVLDYCVDESLEEEKLGTPVTGTVLMVCRHQPLNQQSTWTVVRGVLIPAGLVVSCVFLAATLLCHLCVAPLRDLHGLCLAAYVAALLVADSTLFLTQAVSQYLPPSACVTVAVILHVAFLSAFFWLNVICYDVWKYVGLTVQAVPLYRSPDDFHRFFVYAVYAWGSPLVIGGVAVIIHSLPQHIDWLLKPDFVHNRCWFREGKEILAYFYGPMGVLCVVNTLFISHTGLRLCCADRKCDCLFGRCRSPDHTLYRTHMAEFWQRFTLFALMVVCWVMEVVSWMIGPADSELWALTDTLNTFQGVFIFMTFLRSNKKRRLVLKTLAQWSGFTDGGSRLTPARLSTSVGPNNVLYRLRNSLCLGPFVRWCSRFSSRRSHLTRQQVLDNIIFKGKIETSRDFNKETSEADAAELECDARRSVCGDEPVNKSFNPIWTLPHWKSHWSNIYFPNVLGTVDHSRDEIQREELVCENFTDSLSLYSTYEQEVSIPYTALDQRPTFANWNLLRNKTGSLTLATGDNAQAGGDKVVCHGLTRKESLRKK